MLLLLIRHGIAEDLPKAGASDAERALTDEGIRKMKCGGLFLKELNLQVELVVSSPLKRAVQTAEVLVSKLDCSAPIEVESALAPGGLVDEAIGEIGRRSQHKVVIAVSHQPLISALGASLLGMPPGQLGFKRGAILALEFDGPPKAGRANLLWAVTPKIYCLR